MYKVYCINIKNRIDRRNQILNQFKQFDSIDLEFIEAVTPNYFSAEQFYEFDEYQKRLSTNTAFKYLSKEEICTFYSHLKAYEYLKNSDYDYALIIEDDIILEVNFLTKFKKLSSFFKTNDLLLLGGDTGIAYFNNKNQWRGVNSFMLKMIGRKYFAYNLYTGYPIDRIWGAYGYLIGKTASNKLLLEFNRGLFCVADRLTSDSPKFNINLLAINKPIILHDYNFSSNIRIEHEYVVQKGIRYGFYKSILRILKRNIRNKYSYIN